MADKKGEKAVVKLTFARQRAFEALLPQLLESPLVVDGIEAGVGYERLHDDHDGRCEGSIRVMPGPDGDVWIETDQHKGPMLRFRTTFGGGRSPRVWNALRILALAIKLDQAERPDNPQ